MDKLVIENFMVKHEENIKNESIFEELKNLAKAFILKLCQDN